MLWTVDVLLDRGGTFVVQYIQCRMVATGFQYGDDFCECLYHGSIGARRHGPDNDCIMVVDVGNKHVLHTFEGADREGAGDVGIHGARCGIVKRGKAEHILHSTDFLRGKHAINLGTCSDNVGLHVASEGCIRGSSPRVLTHFFFFRKLQQGGIGTLSI